MFILKYSKTYGFGIMEKNQLNQTIEDKFCVRNNVFCLADGVTRDFVDGTQFAYPKTIEEAEIILEKYPKLSGAADAAEICVEDIVNLLISDKEANFMDIIKKANNHIKSINDGRKLNYLNEDSYCCTAVGGIINDDKLRCFSIGDSGIKVLDEECNVLFDSTINLVSYGGKMRNLLNKIFKNTFSYKRRYVRAYVRKHERNNLKLKLKGRNNIGVLDGSDKALQFVFEYEYPLENAKYILVFSDGCDEFLSSKEKLKNVIRDPESIRYGECEKTLIIYENI